jgi:hypothetical protein
MFVSRVRCPDQGAFAPPGPEVTTPVPCPGSPTTVAGPWCNAATKGRPQAPFHFSALAEKDQLTFGSNSPLA